MTVQDWFEKRKEAQIQRRELEAKVEVEMDPDLWTKCVHCDAQLLKEDLVKNDMVCPVCDYHFRINARTRINQLFDENSFEELFTEIKPTDPLEFVDTESYKDRLEKANKKIYNIEKYTREKNYPATSRIVSKSDIKRLGLNTFFFSDASSAIKTSIYKELNGYDGKDLPTNEDMYIAYKLIMNGYKISYDYLGDKEYLSNNIYNYQDFLKEYLLSVDVLNQPQNWKFISNVIKNHSSINKHITDYKKVEMLISETSNEARYNIIDKFGKKKYECVLNHFANCNS